MNKKQSNKKKLILKKSVLKQVVGANNSGGNQGSEPQFAIFPPLYDLKIIEKKP
ncbi:hypothetical protein [Pseudoalteromonas luteoviolacea]|uniref:hypothetical protein n=1 Tax=Pseudoalteromonas luteoviolacea TaxID=43657 RepID=UPI001B370C6F|nr:hypothetical protein [Pseudoalteromonas luteoviolacea]MBQ4839825.1 hypothetical protein [Pseudoalteromonas luteoviolacea]